jgi:hypothetical protein
MMCMVYYKRTRELKMLKDKKKQASEKTLIHEVLLLGD